MKKKTKKVWALIHEGDFIAAFRFKPKRVYEGKKGEGYYAWTDCNGPRYGYLKDYADNVIEGSAGAKCIPVTISFTIPKK